METVRDRIISFLREHPEGADDDELARALNLRQRQQANSLQSKGLWREKPSAARSGTS